MGCQCFGCVEPSFLRLATLRKAVGLLKIGLRCIGVAVHTLGPKRCRGRQLHIGDEINDTQLGTYLLNANAWIIHRREPGPRMESHNRKRMSGGRPG